MNLTVKEDDFKVLSDLGLSHCQAKIYLTLLKLGVDSKATSIFRYSGVARQDVYRVLRELQHLGFVQKIVSKPTRFRAVEPKKAMSILLEKKAHILAELNDKAQDFAKRAADMYMKISDSSEKDQLLLISEKSALINKCIEVIERTTMSIDFMTPGKEFVHWVNSVGNAFELASISGTHVRWIIGNPSTQELKNIQQVLLKKSFVQIKYTSNPLKAKLGVYDAKEIICAIIGEGSFAEVPALWSNSPTIAALAKSYFDDCWKNGTHITAP
jgi:sugar-specific transcriptional regulator TrmB